VSWCGGPLYRHFRAMYLLFHPFLARFYAISVLLYVIYALCLPCQAGNDVKFFKIYRWNPDKPGEKPYMATYPINTKEYDCFAEFGIFLSVC
jgi:hypothetical protein